MKFLKQSMHTLITLPFYLFVMTALASYIDFTHDEKFRKLSIYHYRTSVNSFNILFKDLSIALGKTDRIPLILSIWTLLSRSSFFASNRIIQINEK